MNKYFYCLPSHGKHPARQHGVILLIALVVLLVMTLTVLVLVRTTTPVSYTHLTLPTKA